MKNDAKTEIEFKLNIDIQARIQLFRQRGVQSWIYMRNVALSLVNYWAYSQTPRPIGPYTLHCYLRLFHSKCNRPIQVSVYDHNVKLFKLIIQCGPYHFCLSKSHKYVSLSSSTRTYATYTAFSEVGST